MPSIQYRIHMAINDALLNAGYTDVETYANAIAQHAAPETDAERAMCVEAARAKLASRASIRAACARPVPYGC